MPSVRSTASKHYTYVVAVILLLSEVMPICFYCIKKKLIYIIIAALFSCQPFFYIEYTKLNIRLSYNI